MRSFEDTDSLRILKACENRSRLLKLSWIGESIIMLAEYVIALAAIANVVTQGYELGVQVVCSFAPQLKYIPLLWGFWSLTVHTTGVIALHLKTNIRRTRSGSSVLHLMKRQFTPLTKQHDLSVSLVRETYLFIFLSWGASLLSACHVIAGTLAFSSMLFISVRDSLTVITRLMASVLWCIIILMYELALLRVPFDVGTASEVHDLICNTKSCI
jgi:hypothetical protein